MTEKKIETWRDVWTLPLHFEQYCPFMMLDSKSIRAFDFEWRAWEDYDHEFDRATEYLKKRIVDKLNGEQAEIDLLKDFKYDGGMIRATYTVNGKEYDIMLIRAWGHLTGTGGLHLPVKKAAELQDGFGKYIIDTLNS